MATRFRIGIDLGGTKIEAAAVDRLGAVRVRRRVATPTGNYRATIEVITTLVEVIELEIGETAPIGIGIPGAISPITGLINNANSTWLIGRPLQRDLETALGRPIRLANDANCFALSEATDGAAAGMGRSSASFSAPGSEGASPWQGGSSSAPTRSLENGATTRCPGRRRTRARDRRAIAGARAVSRPFFRGRLSRRIIIVIPGIA